MAGLLFGLVTLQAGAASAYQQTHTPSGAAIMWDPPCVRWYLNEAGSDDVDLPAVVTETMASFQSWEEVACSALEFHYEGLTDSTLAGYNPVGDNENLIVWRETNLEWRHAPTALGLTTVTFCERSQGPLCPSAGAIIDTDIEVNGARHVFTDQPRAPGFDVRNTLTHEIGHVLGLDHSMVASSTMYPTAPEGERSKAVLGEDDILGLCAVYPVEHYPGTCGFGPDATTDIGDDAHSAADGEPGHGELAFDSPGSSGCAMTAPPRSGLAWWVAVCGLACILVRRRVRSTAARRFEPDATAS